MWRGWRGKGDAGGERRVETLNSFALFLFVRSQARVKLEYERGIFMQ